MLTSDAAVSSARAADGGRLLPRRSTLRSLFSENLPREHGFEPLRVEGTVPTDLRGTLYRQGPALFSLFGRRYEHIFEGDGATTAVRFGDGSPTGAARVVESAGLALERERGRMLHGFSAPLLSRLRYRRIKNTANTNIVSWQGRLFALMEAALPTEVDPQTLQAIGETDLGGVVRGTFSAHPHHVPARNALYNFGVSVRGRPSLHFYELPEVGSARRMVSLPIDGIPMLHDFIATDDHLIVFLHPVRASIGRALLPVGSFEEFFSWREDRDSEIIIVPIDAPEKAVRFRQPAFWNWHFANAFEESGKLVVDYVRYSDFSSFHMLGTGEDGVELDGYLHRATIDPQKLSFESEQLWDRPCEFPRLRQGQEARPYRDLWMTVEGGSHGVARLDVESGKSDVWELSSLQRASEPVIAGDYALSLVYDAYRHQSYMAVLKADAISEGPVAKVWFDHHIPITFHGCWVAG